MVPAGPFLAVMEVDIPAEWDRLGHIERVEVARTGRLHSDLRVVVDPQVLLRLQAKIGCLPLTLLFLKLDPLTCVTILKLRNFLSADFQQHLSLVSPSRHSRANDIQSEASSPMNIVHNAMVQTVSK